MKLKSDKSFIEFLRSGSSVRIGLILLLGAILILVGSLGNRAQTAKNPDTEARVAEMCSLAEGVGRCEVMLTYSESGEVVSALVLCDGGNLPEVRARVSDMVSSLFGIGTNRIRVQKISD